MNKPTSLTVAAAAAAACLLPATASAQSDAIYERGRPHSTVTLRQANGIAPELVRAATRIDGRRLVVDVTVRARAANETRGRLRIARCPDDRRTTLLCPTAASTRVRLAGRDQQVRFRIARPAEGGTVQLTLAPESTKPTRIVSQLPASLVLPDEAWRSRAVKGSTFEAQITPTPGLTIPFLRVDAVGISDVRVRPTIRWTALSEAATTLRWQCTGAPGCAASVRDQPLPAGRPITVQRRPGLNAASAMVGVTGTVGDAEVFRANLPRPIR